VRPILEARPQPVALRAWALLFMIGGVASLLGGAVAAASGLRPGPAIAIGVVALAVAAVSRYRPSLLSGAGAAALPTIAIVLIALAGETYGVGVGFGAADVAAGGTSAAGVANGLGVGAAAFYVVVFGLIGATNPRGRSLAFSLFLGGAIVAPLALDGRLTALALSAAVVVVALCVAVGEGIGWLLEAQRGDQANADEDDTDAIVRAILGTATDASIVVDRSGVIAFASPAVTEILHREPTELVGRDVGTIVTPTSAAAIREAHRSLELGATRSLDCEIVRDAGNRLAVQVMATRLGPERGLVLTVQDATRWKALEEELTKQAFSDSLTGLANRALYIDRLGHALGRRRHHARGPAVLFLDLDDFKTVNDTLGHVEGDALIRSVAGRLVETIRPEDTAARLGGDEFAVLLDDVDEDQAVIVASRVLQALDRPFDLSDRQVRIGTTIGIALASPDLPDATDMLRAADIAMYAAKDDGKGRFRVFVPAMQQATVERLRLSVDLRGALERKEFVLHYQPTVTLPAGTVTGMEALVRWDHPERGIVPPMEFIPLAERTGLIVPLGEYILREACRQARAWQLARPGQAPLMMSVNLSGIQLRDPGIVAAVSLALEDSQLPAELLTLEITESVMAHETEEVIRRLRQLKGLGVGIAIDDFGTGYSSLSYLRRFPIDVVKIDKSFVDGIASGTDDMVLARAIVRLAHSLKIKTVAEGVELEGQVRRLAKMGSDQAQGFYFAKPMDSVRATAHLVGHTTLNLWVGHSGQELEVIKSVVADFEAQNPGLKVDVTGAVSDERIMAALASGSGPNVVSSFESDNFGIYSSDGGLIDLGPHMERDGISDSLIVQATQAYTRRNDKRWALPMLADTYGLYLNTDLLAATGILEVPRTVTELSSLAKRLTTRDPDGALQTVGFDPLLGFYENSVAVFGHMFGAHWLDESGRSCIASDPAWTRMFTWQKALVDWFGHDALKQFEESVGHEFTPTNAFNAGRLAMMVDGEWRVAFLASEAPDLHYRAAPTPVDDIIPSQYGSGYINGSVIGIPARAGQQRESWKLVRYLATDDSALAKLSNGLRNMPSTKSSLRSPDLVRDDRFAIFLDIFAHPNSASAPVTSIGSSYEEILSEFALEWQAGRVADLRTGLREVDVRIDEMIHGMAADIPRLEPSTDRRPQQPAA
jgi:diguanylate cyclase (GGDEF)-like protein/PAS domain S-box-containing protein